MTFLALPVDERKCRARFQRAVEELAEHLRLIALAHRMLRPQFRIGGGGEHLVPIRWRDRAHDNARADEGGLQVWRRHAEEYALVGSRFRGPPKERRALREPKVGYVIRVFVSYC